MCLLLAFSIAPNNLKTTILGEDMQISTVAGVLFCAWCFCKKKKKKKLQGSSIIAEFLARVRSPIAK